MNKVKRSLVGLAVSATVAVGGGSMAFAIPPTSAASGGSSAATPTSRVTVHPMPIMAMDFDYARLLSRLTGRQLEETFMAGMIGHHQVAVAMATLAERRSEHPELRLMAAKMVVAQRHEQVQMTTWLKAWYALTPAQALAQSPPDARRMIRTMDAEMTHHVMMLRQMPGGPQFDMMFLHMMIPHHQMAINEAQPAQDGVTHSQLLVTANSIVTSQSQEVQHMLYCLIHWYGSR